MFVSHNYDLPSSHISPLTPAQSRAKIDLGEKEGTVLQASFLALPISTSVLGQKCLRSSTGSLTARRISAAIMTKVMYQPKTADYKMECSASLCHVRMTTPINLEEKQKSVGGHKVTHLLQVRRLRVITSANLSIRSRKYPRRKRDKQEINAKSHSF